MSETSQFGLPLIEAAQAQKHVTVNDALWRLDTLAQLRLLSIKQTVPPVSPADGSAYGVPPGAVNAWDGHIGEVAIFSNGGWLFVQPKTGWRAWIADQGAQAVYLGDLWLSGLVATTPGGAVTQLEAVEFTHVIGAGAVDHTNIEMAAGMMVFGISGRIVADIAGAGVTGWQLGDDSVADRFGQALPLTAGAGFSGMSAMPVSFDVETALRLEATGGDFAAGTLKLVIHGMRIAPPDAI